MARNPDKRPCQATTAGGTPCRNYARSDSDYCRAHSPDAPPTLAGAPLGNANSRIHGLYAKFMTADDLASLAIVGADATLDDEIAFTRVVIRRLAQMIEPAAYPRNGAIQEEYVRLLLARNDRASLEAALAKGRELERNSPPQSARWFRAKYNVALAHYRLGNKQQAAKIITLLRLLHPELGGAEMKARFDDLLGRCR